jgi:hypothetical protein
LQRKTRESSRVFFWLFAFSAVAACLGFGRVFWTAFGLAFCGLGCGLALRASPSASRCGLGFAIAVTLVL